MTIADRVPPTDAIAEAVERRFLSRETPHVATIEASELEVVTLADEPVRFSLDGERREYETLELVVRLGLVGLAGCVWLADGRPGVRELRYLIRWPITVTQSRFSRN